MLIGIRPNDAAHVEHAGMVFHGQADDGANMAYYEVQTDADWLDFDLSDYMGGIEDPVLVLNTHWGPTDFTLRDRFNDSDVVSEQSGYDNDVWFVEIDGTSGRFLLSEFDTDDGVDGTTAGWLPFVNLIDASV